MNINWKSDKTAYQESAQSNRASRPRRDRRRGTFNAPVDMAQFEKVPQYRKEERPDEVAEPLYLLPAKGRRQQNDGKQCICDRGWESAYAALRQDDRCVRGQTGERAKTSESRKNRRLQRKG